MTFTVSENITKDYDGEEIVLTASTEEYTGLRYAYQWYKDGEVLAGKNDKTLTLDGNVADSGVYTVKLTVTNAQDSGVITENDAVSTEAEVKVVINKINNSSPTTTTARTRRIPPLRPPRAPSPSMPTRRSPARATTSSAGTPRPTAPATATRAAMS